MGHIMYCTTVESTMSAVDNLLDRRMTQRPATALTRLGISKTKL